MCSDLLLLLLLMGMGVRVCSTDGGNAGVLRRSRSGAGWGGKDNIPRWDG
jgi:hypothetical protein